jgi:hypothetical protein
LKYINAEDGIKDVAVSASMQRLLESLKVEWNLALKYRQNSDSLIKQIHEQGKADGLPTSEIRGLIVFTLRGVRKIGDRQIRNLLPEELKYSQFANKPAEAAAVSASSSAAVISTNEEIDTSM